MDTPQEFPLPAADGRRLDERFDCLAGELDTLLGFPAGAPFDFDPLLKFLRYPLNNLGDPFAGSAVRLNTHEFEREVVAWFAELAGASADQVRGYATSGGTEGNTYGLFLARELYPDATVYASEASHHSIAKALRLLRVPGVIVASRPDGSIDLERFREAVRARRDATAIVIANVGTTMTGAVDDIQGILSVLGDLGIERRYVHADAALSGMILPFVDDAPPWDFAAGVDSIAVSGHKMIGSPLPCGVVLALKAHVDRVARPLDYAGGSDATLAGSRDGVAPLFLWHAIRAAGPHRFRGIVHRCLEMADYAIDRLRTAGKQAWRHRHSITVVFERPSERLVRKWQLSALGPEAHLVAMPRVTRGQIDRFADDVSRDRGADSP